MRSLLDLDWKESCGSRQALSDELPVIAIAVDTTEICEDLEREPSGKAAVLFQMCSCSYAFKRGVLFVWGNVRHAKVVHFKIIRVMVLLSLGAFLVDSCVDSSCFFHYRRMRCGSLAV